MSGTIDGILAAARAAMRGDPDVRVVSASDGADVNAWMDLPDGSSWEIHVPVLARADPALRPSPDYAKGDENGCYHATPADLAPPAVRARGEALVERLLLGGLALAYLDARSAAWIGMLGDIVGAHDSGDEEALAAAVAKARAAAAPYRPDIAEPPDAGAGPSP